MGIIRGEVEVDKMIELMISKSKTGHITQSVTFKKDSPRQMELLKFALMRSESFSGLMKELLANELDGLVISQNKQNLPQQKINENKETPPERIDVGNFL